MRLSVDQAIAYLQKLQFKDVKPGLSRVRALLDAVGNPQNALCTVHVGGTNGKGSVVTMIASVLRVAGYRVGVYTSPHLVSYRERMQINSEWISEEKFSGLADELMSIAETMTDKPSQFEFLTAMGLLYFARQHVDWAVIEVGLGGRFDATNLIHPKISVVTNVELDHTDLLGNTLGEIAWEKAGIAKPGAVLITGESKPEPLAVIERECAARGAPLIRANVKITRRDFDWDSQALEIEELGSVQLGLLGGYQIENAAVAMTALRELQKQISLSDQAIIRGLEQAHWPGRFELVQKSPYIVLDGAHNPHGVAALREDLKRYYKKFLGGKKFLLFGMMADKDFSRSAKLLFPQFDEISLVRPPSPRAAEPTLLAEIATHLGTAASIFSSTEEAMSKIREKMDVRDLLCVAGSLYLVGEVEGILGYGHTTAASQR
ncbi:bifunctional folylpolyglutamate synthase/dihydrofolate synthase [Candidatus Acetothermia bacterium]|nr:bifunctional folylpolyglutamate synthase/dihydrofolate synthase [Candidatus Acetothermia bacterium]